MYSAQYCYTSMGNAAVCMYSAQYYYTSMGNAAVDTVTVCVADERKLSK